MSPDFITLHQAGSKDQRFIVSSRDIGWVYEGPNTCEVWLNLHTCLRTLEVSESIAEIKDKLDGKV